jgi:hypothetical protein
MPLAYTFDKVTDNFTNFVPNLNLNCTQWIKPVEYFKVKIEKNSNFLKEIKFRNLK